MNAIEPDSQPRHGSAQSALGIEPRLLTGGGRFSADISLPGQAYAVFLRATVAHGEVTRLDVADAAALPGVLAVLTGADLAQGGAAHFGPPLAPMGTAAADFHFDERPVLASRMVRHIGEPLAIVVAETAKIATDALELIALDINPLPAVSSLDAALAADAPQISPAVPGNVSYEWVRGDTEAVAAARQQAAHVLHLRLVNQRLVGNAMEPRAALASHDPATGEFLLIAGSQGVSALRGAVAVALGVPPGKLRVVTNDVGGGFGIKSGAYSDYVAMLFAARALGRPVKWVSDRTEGFLSDQQARDSITEGWLAVAEDGTFLGLQVDIAAALGAYVASSGAVVGTRNFSAGLAGPYRMPAIALRSRGVLTNSLPVGPYRGAGRPEASLLVEQLVDAAARKLGMDAAEIRRRNMITPAEIPTTTRLGAFYDSGDFPKVMDAALALADWDGFATRRAASRAAGKLRGIGLASFVEVAGSATSDMVDIRFTDDGVVEIRTSVQSTGQGHGFTFIGLAARTLDVPAGTIRVLAGDSADTPAGPATVGSRGAMVAGAAIQAGCLAALRRARSIAAEYFEVGAEDVTYEAGLFRIVGTDRTVALLDLPRRLREAGLVPAEKLDGIEKLDAANPTFPNGCHVAELEIDPATGACALLAYTAVDDCGTVLNEAAVEGQVMGGVAQGLGQCLLEECVYDADGQIVTASFMDYAMPRADNVPEFRLGFMPVPTPATPLGAKGAGEAGTTGALPAIMNAISDALAQIGAEPVSMPATPEKLWQAIRRATS
jgi:carbon-monoxide dehydrogenase large subunit